MDFDVTGSAGMDHRSRLARAAEATAAAGLEAMVATPGPDLVYLTGYDPPPLERLTALLIRPGHDALLMVPRLELPRAQASPAGGLVDMVTWADGEDPYTALSAMLPEHGRLGLSDRTWAIHVLGMQQVRPGSEVHPGSWVLAGLRRVKDREELRLLGRAAESADEAFARVCQERFEGRSELDVSRLLSAHLLEAGHDSVGFVIVAAGPNGASPHHEPGSRPIQLGDTLVMDFGGRVGGYWSDITRTVSVGEPDEEVRAVHEVVRQAQEAAFRAVRPGVAAQDVDRSAREVIASSGFGEAFIHRTGHGIGLEEHEDPYIVEGNAQTLEPGMAFSIEPGIYLEGRFGVRIEDIVVAGDEGALSLNRAPHELAVVR